MLQRFVGKLVDLIEDIPEYLGIPRTILQFLFEIFTNISSILVGRRITTMIP